MKIHFKLVLGSDFAHSQKWYIDIKQMHSFYKDRVRERRGLSNRL